jgi:nucleoside-diphosphate-sugar epimerase
MSGPVLVTGAAGFAGQHLVRLLAADGPVAGWHRPGTTHPELDGVSWAPVELLDRAAVAAAVRDLAPSAIYHLAGVPHVGDSWAHAEETLAGNVVGTLNLFDGLRRPPRACSSRVRPRSTSLDRRASPKTPVAPNTPYGTSKVAQEMVALGAWREHGIRSSRDRSTTRSAAVAGAWPGFAR